MTLSSSQTYEGMKTGAFGVVVGWLFLQPIAAAVAHVVWLIDKVSPSVWYAVAVFAVEHVVGSIAIRIASYLLDVVCNLFAHQRESTFGKDLLQCLLRSDDVNVVVLLLLTDESADAWRLAAGHYECTLDVWDDHLDE